MAYYSPPPQHQISPPPALVAVTDRPHPGHCSGSSEALAPPALVAVTDRPHQLRYYESLDMIAQLNGLREHSAFADAPPSAESLRLAENYINYVVAAGPIPSNVLTCVDGGVTMLFASGSFSAVLEIFNSGEIVLATSFGPGKTRAIELDRNSHWMHSVVTNVGRFSKYS